MAPARTSPVPPVASAGFSNGARAARPSGAAMTRPGALEDDHLAPPPGGVAGGPLAGVVVGRQVAVVLGRDPARGAQPGELAGVRGQDARPPDALPPLVADGQRAERLGIDHGRRRTAVVLDGEEAGDQLGGREPGTEARTDDDRVVLVVEDPGERIVGLDLLDVVLRQGHRRRLDHPRREQRLERFGNGQGDQPGARPAGRPADEQGSARVVERAGDDEQLPERALVAAGRPLRDERRDRPVVELLERDGVGPGRRPLRHARPRPRARAGGPSGP